MPDILYVRRNRRKKAASLPTQIAVLKVMNNFPNGGNFNEIVDKTLQELHPCVRDDTWSSQKLLHNSKVNVLAVLQQLIRENKIKTSMVNNIVLYHKVITHNEVMIVEED